MAESRRERRGSYAKGVAKREEILERALEVIAREGYRGASIKELATKIELGEGELVVADLLVQLRLVLAAVGQKLAPVLFAGGGVAAGCGLAAGA